MRQYGQVWNRDTKNFERKLLWEDTVVLDKFTGPDGYEYIVEQLEFPKESWFNLKRTISNGFLQTIEFQEKTLHTFIGRTEESLIKHVISKLKEQIKILEDCNE